MRLQKEIEAAVAKKIAARKKAQRQYELVQKPKESLRKMTREASSIYRLESKERLWLQKRRKIKRGEKRMAAEAAARK